jgi:hypothetical protein
MEKLLYRAVIAAMKPGVTGRVKSATPKVFVIRK